MLIVFELASDGQADGRARPVSVITRLHDQANIEQSSSKHPANAFKIHVLDVCSNCSMFVWRLFDVCSMFAQEKFLVYLYAYFLKVCFINGLRKIASALGTRSLSKRGLKIGQTWIPDTAVEGPGIWKQTRFRIGCGLNAAAKMCKVCGRSFNI